LAKSARPRAAKPAAPVTKPAATRRRAAKATPPAAAEPVIASAADEPLDEATFALRSLQQAHANNRRFEASDDELLHFYEQMVLIRRFEEKAGQLYGLGLIGGFCHLYIGQEAVAVGLQSALSEGHDSVITGYRDHGHMLAYGIDPKVIMAELTGRGAGISRGKGGSMHMFSTDHKFYGGHGIVGAQVPLGAGWPSRTSTATTAACAWPTSAMARPTRARSMKPSTWRRCGSCRSCSWWKTTATPWARRSSAVRPRRISTARHRLPHPGIDVNGMDVLEVRQAAEVALEFVRGGNGPVLLELKTYRYRGHSMSDPAKYRSREEVQEMREKHDPIEAAKTELLQRGVAEDRIKDIDKKIRQVVAEAADFAESSPEPALAELYTDVVVEQY
jgi:pyruvate dehydrogenase E1 component alpha subunit